MTERGKIIVLVGIMGSGKTRVGQALSKLLALPFVDSDREIERMSRYSVGEIFEKFGEGEFRLREKQIMLRLLNDGTQKVLASGGGGFIQPEIRHEVQEKAISVWLKPNINVLVERNGRNNKRPMLQGSDIESRLRQLMDVRYPVYAEADITIVTDGQTPHDTARLIKMEMDRHLGRKGNSAVHV